MVVDRKLTVESLGKAFAEHLRNEPDVRELWVAEDEDGFVVSIITDEIDPERERHLYAYASPIQRKLPDALFEVHVSNPRYYPSLSGDQLRTAVLPSGARRIQLKQ